MGLLGREPTGQLAISGPGVIRHRASRASQSGRPDNQGRARACVLGRPGPGGAPAGEGINIIDDVISSSLISDTNDYLEILFTRVGHMQDADDTLPTAYSFFGHSFSWTP